MIRLKQTVSNESYESNDFVMKREYGTAHPETGMVFDGHWVLRKKNGEFIDSGKYRFDIAELHNIQLI